MEEIYTFAGNPLDRISQRWKSPIGSLPDDLLFSVTCCLPPLRPGEATRLAP